MEVLDPLPKKKVEQSIKSSVSPFWARGLMRSYKLHTYKTSPLYHRGIEELPLPIHPSSVFSSMVISNVRNLWLCKGLWKYELCGAWFVIPYLQICLFAKMLPHSFLCDFLPVIWIYTQSREAQVCCSAHSQLRSSSATLVSALTAVSTGLFANYSLSHFFILCCCG